MTSAEERSQRVVEYFKSLQDSICRAAEAREQEVRFDARELEGERGRLARPRVLSEGETFERAAANFSHSKGDQLPPAASQRRPELAGRAFEAMAVSVIFHPRNPYVPTSHFNVRFFNTFGEDGADDTGWWFGGGYDLTPYYGFVEDARHWHETARDACREFGPDLYARLKQACDEYFFLPHRDEARGIGGLFFDDLESVERSDHDARFEAAVPDPFGDCFDFVKRVGDSYLDAYLPIVDRRCTMEYAELERSFQLYRRGRYVEFNLLHDRGTRYGLQAGARTESVLASMPPLVRWSYDWTPEPGTDEARLYDEFLKPREWVED